MGGYWLGSRCDMGRFGFLNLFVWHIRWLCYIRRKAFFLLYLILLDFLKRNETVEEKSRGAQELFPGVGFSLAYEALW